MIVIWCVPDSLAGERNIHLDRQVFLAKVIYNDQPLEVSPVRFRKYRPMVPTLELPCIPGYHLKYADHGELEQDSERGYWLPVDAEPISTANWISNLQITDILEAMSAKHVMVIADSCYSGTIDLARLF